MSNARNLANLLGAGTTIATASIADDAITAAKIDDDGAGFVFGDVTVGNITSTGVTTGFVSPDSIILDSTAVTVATVNSAVSASATIVVDTVTGTIAVGQVVTVQVTDVRAIIDASSETAISVDKTLTITAVASQTSFTVSEAVTIADNVALFLTADGGENFVLDASAASTDVGGKIQFEDATNDVSTLLKDGLPSGIAVNSPSLPAGSVLQVVTATDSTERTTASTSYVTASNTLAVAITPSSTSSKIYITASFSYGSPTGTYGFLPTIFRGSTNLGGPTARFGNMFSSHDYNYGHATLNVLDEDVSTTSEVIYQIYFKTATNLVRINNGGGDGSFSTITAFEIAG